MLYRRPTPFLLLLLLPYTSVTVQAASVAGTTPDSNTEIITVTTSSDADLNSLNTPNYQMLERDDFINTSQTLGDLLQKVNGIQIRQISGLGNTASVSIRGSSTKQVQLYIDGQLVNDSQFGGFDLNQIPTEQIDSIEISKSLAMGTGITPIGGVIRINTYNPQEDSARFSLAGGSFGYKDINLMANKMFTNSSLAAGFSHLESDNNYNYQVPQTFTDPNASKEEKLNNNAFEKNAFHINNEIYLNQHLLRFNFQYTEQRKELANYQNNSPENNSEISSDSWRFGYLHNWQPSIVWLDQVEFEAYTQHIDEVYLDQPTGVEYKRSNYETIKNFVGIKPTIIASDLEITPFINFNYQTFESISTLKGQPATCNGMSNCDIKATQGQLSYGSRIEWPIADLALIPYALISQLHEKNSNKAINQERTEYSSSKNYDTQEFGIAYHPNKFNNNKKNELDFSAFLNWSKGIRTPTLYEMFGDRGNMKGNPNLKPEQAETWSFGSSISYADLALTGSIYQQKTDNSIVAIFNTSGDGSHTNVSSATLIGLELQANYQANAELSFVLQTNLIDSNTQSEYSGFDNKKLPGIYHQQYNVGIRYALSKNWQVNLRTNIDNELYFNRANILENTSSNTGSGNPTDRFTTDLQLGWQQGPFTANLSINNVLDAYYKDLANRPAQGRNIQIKIAIKEI